MLSGIAAGLLEPVSTSSRVLVIFWSLFSVIIIATYTANLAAFLTVTIVDLPINTLDDLANSKEIYPLVKKGTSLIELFSVSAMFPCLALNENWVHISDEYVKLFNQERPTGSKRTFFGSTSKKNLGGV